MLPTYLQQEIDKLSPVQRLKFFQLIAWSTSNSLEGISTPMSYAAYEGALKMVLQMPYEAEPEVVRNEDEWPE